MAEGGAPVVDTGPAVAAFAVAGNTSAPASLTWGQRAIRRTAPGDHYFNPTRVLSLAGRGRPVDVAGVTTALGLLIGRHQALRTRLVAAEPEPRLTHTLPTTRAATRPCPARAALRPVTRAG
jgi:hypothetical protein